MIKIDKEWVSVIMVLLDPNLETVEIFEAERSAIPEALTAPGSKAR